MRQTIGRLVAGAAALEVPGLMLIAPALFFPTPGRALALLVIPFFWITRRLASGHFVPRTPLDPAILLLLIMVGVSVPVSPDPLFSLPKVTGVLLGIGFFYAVSARAATPNGRWLMVLLLLAVALGIAALGLVGTQWANSVPLLRALTARLPLAVTGLPGSPDGFNPNVVSGALLFAAPLALLLAGAALVVPARLGPLGRGLLPRLGLVIAALFLIGTLLLAESRGGYLGLVGGIVALVAFRSRRAALGSGVALAATAWALLAAGLEPLSLDLATGSGSINSLAARMELWERAIYIMEDFPLTGVGMGMFRRVVPLLYPTFRIPPTVDLGHAHNQWLAAGVDVGVPGLIAFGALWLGAGWMTWQSRRWTDEPAVRLLVLGLAAGLAAHATWALFDANVLGAKGAFPFWIVLGILAGLHRQAAHTRRPEAAHG